MQCIHSIISDVISSFKIAYSIFLNNCSLPKKQTVKMSTAMTFGQKQFIPTAPDKGSFPLDHEGICKKSMVSYMNCLFSNNSDNSKCRNESKEYLACRMEHNLMAKEDWSKLGFKDEESP